MRIRPEILMTYCLGESQRVSDEQKFAALEENLVASLTSADIARFRVNPLEHQFELGGALKDLVRIFVHGESGGSLEALENNFILDKPSSEVSARRDEVYAGVAARLNQRIYEGLKLQAPATRQDHMLVHARWRRKTFGPRQAR